MADFDTFAKATFEAFFAMYVLDIAKEEVVPELGFGNDAIGHVAIANAIDRDPGIVGRAQTALVEARASAIAALQK